MPSEAKQSLQLRDLSLPVQQVAQWIAGRFDKEARWPSNFETRAFCYDHEVAFELIGRESSVFEDVYDGPDTEARPVGVKMWVLRDAGACARAFGLAERIIADAIPELRKTAGPVEWTKDEIGARYGLGEDTAALVHLNHLLSKSRVSVIGERERMGGAGRC